MMFARVLAGDGAASKCSDLLVHGSTGMEAAHEHQPGSNTT